jgi:hypothetical protein
MIYAATRAEVEMRRKAFVRKWRLKCRAVADSLKDGPQGPAGRPTGSRAVTPSSLRNCLSAWLIRAILAVGGGPTSGEYSVEAQARPQGRLLEEMIFQWDFVSIAASGLRLVSG